MQSVCNAGFLLAKNYSTPPNQQSMHEKFIKIS
jgi:hypothetical protein